jgi:hypothetical protein
MNDILEKIRKLLNTAKDAAATPAEAETALRLAIKLQASNGITDIQIRSHIQGADNKADGIKIDVSAIKERTILTTGRMGRWDLWIATAVGIASRSKIYIVQVGRREKEIRAYGLPTDLEVCKALFDYAFEVAERLRKFYCAVKAIEFGGKAGKAWMDGFCLGLQEAARKEVEEQKTLKELTNVVANSGALIVVSAIQLDQARIKAQTQYAREKLNLRGTVGVAAPRTGESSYSAGHRSGASQNLSRNTIGH